MQFVILGEISAVETIAAGSGIREIARLRKIYGSARWRKRKGLARVRPQGIQNQASALKTPMAKAPSKQFVVCVDNEGYQASLETWKIYVSLRDAAAEKNKMLRVIDESGEDFLYPKTFFRAIALPLAIKKAVLAAA